MDFGRYKRTEINFSERPVYCERNDTVFEIVAAGEKQQVRITPAVPATADGTCSGGIELGTGAVQQAACYRAKAW